MYLQLYQLKKQLNIDEEFHQDDEYLVDLAMAAENVVQTHIDRDLSELEDENGMLPASITHAMLLLVGNFYANRESVAFASAQILPHAYDYLIALYKNYDGDKEGTKPIYQ